MVGKVRGFLIFLVLDFVGRNCSDSGSNLLLLGFRFCIVLHKIVAIIGVSVATECTGWYIGSQCYYVRNWYFATKCTKQSACTV